MRVIWSPAALADIGRLYDYIVAFNPTAAAELARQLKQCGDSLCDFPERGHPIANRRRELVVLWPYVIRYRLRGEEVQNLTVRHGRPQRRCRTARPTATSIQPAKICDVHRPGGLGCALH